MEEERTQNCNGCSFSYTSHRCHGVYNCTLFLCISIQNDEAFAGNAVFVCSSFSQPIRSYNCVDYVDEIE